MFFEKYWKNPTTWNVGLALSLVVHILSTSVCNPKFILYVDCIATVSIGSRLIDSELTENLYILESFDNINQLWSGTLSAPYRIPILDYNDQPPHLRIAPPGPLPLSILANKVHPCSLLIGPTPSAQAIGKHYTANLLLYRPFLIYLYLPPLRRCKYFTSTFTMSIGWTYYQRTSKFRYLCLQEHSLLRTFSVCDNVHHSVRPTLALRSSVLYFFAKTTSLPLYFLYVWGLCPQLYTPHRQ